MKIKPEWSTTHGQYVYHKGTRYSVSAIIDLASDLPVLKAPIDAFAMDYDSPCENSLISFSKHMKQVNDADLTHPIILCPEGVILDGRHRLIKCLVEGIEDIKFKRLTEMPKGIIKTEESE